MISQTQRLQNVTSPCKAGTLLLSSFTMISRPEAEAPSLVARVDGNVFGNGKMKSVV